MRNELFSNLQNVTTVTLATLQFGDSSVSVESSISIFHRVQNYITSLKCVINALINSHLNLHLSTSKGQLFLIVFF